MLQNRYYFAFDKVNVTTNLTQIWSNGISCYIVSWNSEKGRFLSSEVYEMLFSSSYDRTQSNTIPPQHHFGVSEAKKIIGTGEKLALFYLKN